MADATYHVVAPGTQPAAGQPAHGRSVTAILVAHGMGQQTPFQTLDDLVTGLRRYCRLPGLRGHRTDVKNVRAGQEILQRLEATLTLPDGTERDVHIYEAYWAPLTEGKVSLRDVIEFLLRGGGSGTLHGLQPFKRWMFDKYVHFAAPVRTVLYLTVALGTVVSLVALNVIIFAVAAARAPVQSPPAWLSPACFRDLTVILNALVLVFAAFAALFGLSVATRRMRGVRTVFGIATVVAFTSAVWATMASAVAAGMVLSFHVLSSSGELSFFDRLGWTSAVAALDQVVDRWMFVLVAASTAVAALWWILGVMKNLPGALRRSPRATGLTVAGFVAIAGLLAFFALTLYEPFASGISSHPWRLGLAWPLVLVAAAIVRWFLIQFMGDVAAYVQPQVLDRFAEVRKKIKDTVWRKARAVYSLPYDDVILIGHSLGSVIIYDALNRLIVEEQVNTDHAPRDVAKRTRLLLTFGSPLDKTAFIFGVLGRRAEAREALAAAVQPLIADESVRPRWINIHSPWDPISGSLDFYDLPDRSNRHAVENVRDPDATTLLLAHLEYWKNPTLFRTILEALR